MTQFLVDLGGIGLLMVGAGFLSRAGGAAVEAGARANGVMLQGTELPLSDSVWLELIRSAPWIVALIVIGLLFWPKLMEVLDKFVEAWKEASLSRAAVQKQMAESVIAVQQQMTLGFQKLADNITVHEERAANKFSEVNGALLAVSNNVARLDEDIRDTLAK